MYFLTLIPQPLLLQPFLRFYAGVPIKLSHKGVVYKLGTVCVLDRSPHPVFSVTDKQLLLDVSALVTDELELQRNWAGRLMEENQRYITCTAHDLKTPLTVFKLATTMFKDHFRQLQDAEAEVSLARSKAEGDHPRGRKEKLTRGSISASELLEMAEQADVACDMMQETVSNAIDSARARWATPGAGGDDESGRVEGRPVVIGDLLDECRRLSNQHHGEVVDMRIEVSEAVPGHLLTDANRLRRILVNLVTNACKSSCVGGGSVGADGLVLIRASTVSTGVGDSVEPADVVAAFQSSWLRVEVHDNGPGVPPTLAPKLFREPFVASDLGQAGRGGADDTGDELARRFQNTEVFSGTEEATYQCEKVVAARKQGDRGNFVNRQGAGLGLFVTNLYAINMGGSCGFQSVTPGGGTLGGDGGEVGSGGCPTPEPCLGGSVFWVDLPLFDRSDILKATYPRVEAVAPGDEEVPAYPAGEPAEQFVDNGGASGSVDSKSSDKRSSNEATSWCRVCDLKVRTFRILLIFFLGVDQIT